MKIDPRLRRGLTRLTRNTAFLALGAPLHLLTGLLLVVIATLIWDIIGGGDSSTPVILGFTVALTALCVPALTAAQRWRFRQLLGIDVPRQGRQPARQLGYHSLAGALFGTLEALVLLAALAPAWIYAFDRPYVTVAGVLALAAFPPSAAALVRLESQVVPSLLGHNREEALARRVEDLTLSRAGAVDAAAAERRRIERDLHDGAQQRLVSLALNLGLARTTLDLPPEAREVIDTAHREAKEAIEELNNLVRGLHPSVLDELGLDAALSGLAARTAAHLRVDLPRRPPPPVEAVAYFVVSEALTNVAKHSNSTRTDVTVTLLGDMLRLVISDDGLGGADPARGTGLTGLAQRVRSVDGTFRMSSPVGGPTTMSVELPCAQ
ncbi:histidine kinase [Lentzea sp. NPDC051838]|uniref:sensor histidine kinase n=1 Tax=Lentzea sp. NPDC051838 TaxID=3154849 RepID=UPI00341A3340